MKKRVLITGASGFIGANLVRRLIQTGNEVHVLTRPASDAWRIVDVLTSVQVHSMVLTDTENIKKTVKKIKPDIVFNLAAFGAYPFQTDLSLMIEVNITFPSMLYQALEGTGCKLFVHTGSSSEYGYKDAPMKETDTLEPASFYAATKASFSMIARVCSNASSTPLCVIRPFSVFGPYEESTRLVPTAILRCMDNKPVMLTKGREKRDFIYIDDIIDGYLAVSRNTNESAGKVINLGSGRQHSTREVVTLIHKLAGSRSMLRWGTYKNRSWDADNWIADVSRAKNLLNWQPQYSLEEGLKKAIEWFTKNKELYEKTAGAGL